MNIKHQSLVAAVALALAGTGPAMAEADVEKHGPQTAIEHMDDHGLEHQKAFNLEEDDSGGATEGAGVEEGTGKKEKKEKKEKKAKKEKKSK